MKKLLNKKSLQLFLFVSCLSLMQNSGAATFTVRKVKGKQAVIDYNGPSLESGRTYQIGQVDHRANNENRSHFALIREIAFSNLNSTTGSLSAGRLNRFALSLGYGWNHESYEYAPLIGFTTLDTGSGVTTVFNLGALFDYNFQNNAPGITSILGLSAELNYSKTNSANGNDSPATTGGFASGFWKWFAFGHSTCIRFDLGYLYSKTSGTTESTSSGVSGKGSFAVYF